MLYVNTEVQHVNCGLILLPFWQTSLCEFYMWHQNFFFFQFQLDCVESDYVSEKKLAVKDFEVTTYSSNF